MNEVYIFDMDGLLMDSEPLWRKAEIACFQKLGIHLTNADCELTMGMRIDEVTDYWAQHYPKILNKKAKERLCEDIVNRMESLILNEAEPLPGALALIDYTVTADIPCAIASSSYSVLIEAFIRKFNLDDKIKCRVSAQDLKYGKPHPKIFIYTARKLKAAHNCCTVFEDSVNGVIAAKAAKMKCVAIPEISQLKNPKFSIADEIHPTLKSFLIQHQTQYGGK